MPSAHAIGRVGETLLVDYLRDRGRDVKKSDKKTFDLIVDDTYAEVKSKGKPYSELDFIGLTDNQFRALTEGPDFTLFIVTNVNQPESLEVVELSARGLLAQPPKVESTFYWYKRQIDAILAGSAGMPSPLPVPVPANEDVVQGTSLKKRGSSFLDREVFEACVSKVPTRAGGRYKDIGTIYGDLSRLVVAFMAKTEPGQLGHLYNELGWGGAANSRAIHEAAKRWMADHGRP